MATLVCFWKVKCSQKVTKTTVFSEGNFNRKCQSHVWFWFCSRGMFTQGLRKPLFLPRECGPQASITTCAFASIGVACSELVVCEENSIAAKTSVFQGFLVFVMRCKGRYPQPFSFTFCCCLRYFCFQCERLWHSIIGTLTSGSHGIVGLFSGRSGAHKK